jgi:hypothetical protein
VAPPRYKSVQIQALLIKAINKEKIENTTTPRCPKLREIIGIAPANKLLIRVAKSGIKYILNYF